MIRILLVDDQPLFREGLRAVLSAEAGFEVVGDAANGEEALRECARVRPDVVLMDLQMPVLDGVSAMRKLQVSQPNCRVVALTTFEDDERVFEALRAGAAGYLLKDASLARLKDAIRAAAAGEAFLQPSVASKVLAELSRLRASQPAPRSAAEKLFTQRELEVLRLLARAASNKEIASALFISEGTVKNHLTSIFTKLDVQDRTQAALKAKELGLS